MKSFLKSLRTAPPVADALYAVGRPLNSLAQIILTRTTRHVMRNGGAVEYDGIPLRFPRNVGLGFLSVISWHGTKGFEPETWATLRRLIESSNTFLDVGANIGFYSVLAKRVAPAIDVISFEPMPAVAAQNRAFHAANGVVPNLEELALSDADGQAILFTPEEEESTTSTLATESWQARKAHREFAVRTAKLDSYLAGRHLREPLAIKIDVEDHEAAVLRGALDTIRRYKPAIVCEILARPVRPNSRVGNEILPAAEQHGNAATLQVLAAAGYAAFAITTEGYFRVTADDFKEDRVFRDFLLLPEENVDPTRNYFAVLPAQRSEQN